MLLIKCLLYSGHHINTVQMGAPAETRPHNLIALRRSRNVASGKCRNCCEHWQVRRSSRLITFQCSADQQHIEWNRRNVAAHRIHARVDAGHVQFGSIGISVPLLHRVKVARNLSSLRDPCFVPSRNGILFLKHIDDCAQLVGQWYSATHVGRLHSHADDREEVRSHLQVNGILACSLCESIKVGLCLVMTTSTSPPSARSTQSSPNEF